MLVSSHSTCLKANMKKHIWLMLFSLLLLLSAASSYVQYQQRVEMETQYIKALEDAYITIEKKDWETAALASMIEMLTDEYNNLYEAYCKCCEPKVTM